MLRTARTGLFYLKDTMQIFSQNDLRWKNSKIGFDTGPSDTIGNYGCYMTAIANVCSWAGNDLTPKQINDLCIQNGWLVSSDLISRDDVPSLLCSNLTFNGKTTWHDATSMNFFDDASDPNIAYIICIDALNAPGIQTHFVMVEKTLGGGDLQIADSWDGVLKPLSHYGNPSVIIQSATKFTRTHAATEPATPTADAKYQVTETYPDGKQIQLNKQPTNLWGMNYDFDYMKDHPVEVHNQGEIWTVINKVHHQNGYDYYRRADQVDGFNVLDCNDYTPAPYVPPAAPIEAAKAEKYKLVTTVKYYGSLDNAQKDRNALGTVSQGEYFVFATEGIFKNLSTSNMDNQNKWINILDNRVIVTPPTTRLDPPELTKEIPNPTGDIPPPSNWRGTLNLGFAGMFVFIQDTDVIDLEGNNPPKKAVNGDYLQISGKFTGPDGKEYARPINKPGYFMWYGVPIENLRPYDEVYGTNTTIQEREVLHTLTKADKIELWLAKIKKFSAPVWDIVAPKRSKK